MNISAEMNDALQMLRGANILNTGRVVSDFLRTSATETDICAYIEKNADKVVLETELHAFTAQKKFPEDPRICVPFIYTLLYIFDTEKITAEDFVTSVYRKTDLDEAIETFFSEMARSLAVSLVKINPEDLVPDSETEEIGSDIDRVLSEFATALKALNIENEMEIRNALTCLRSAISSNDPDKIKKAYSSLAQLVSIDALQDALFDIKSEIARMGVAL